MRDDGGDLFFRFISDFIKYEWWKVPKNWKKLK